MADNSPISSARPAPTAGAILASIVRDLREWAKSSSGTISVAADPANVFELFADSPQGWRAIIHLEGDQPAESDDRTATSRPVALHTLRAIVQSNIGPTLNRGEGALVGDDLKPSLDQLISAFRKRMLAYRFQFNGEQLPVLKSQLKYGGRIPYEPQGVTMAAYQLTFTFWATLDYPAQSDVVALDVAPG